MVRIKDIARKAGVSPTTVSNVIHGNDKKVSKETVEKIQKLLKEMDYVPSMGAVMLVGGNSRLIGVLAGEPGGKGRLKEGNAFANELIRALESEIYKRNYYMLLHFVSTAEEGIQFAATWNVEGLVTLGFSARDNEKLQLKCRAPVVSVDVYYEKQRVANVGLDDREGGCQMADYLFECGHRELCFLADNDVGVDHERWEGVLLSGRKRGIRETEIRHMIIPQNIQERKMYYEKHLKELAQTADVLFFASDYYAAEAVAYLQDMGLSVPRDISVAGFDDSEVALLCRPRLTTMRQDNSRKGALAVKKLFEYIEGTRGRTLDAKLKAELVVRDSVADRKCI